ncbi:MAG TPA: thiamine pyrophosphate-binding protein [Bacillota bacterium]
MKVYEALAHAVAAEGVDTLFGLMAEDNMNFMVELNELYGDRIRIIGASHEQNAMAMADGYARASGRLGVCSVGRGPGIAQTGTTLVSAAKRRSKLLVIVPDAPVSNPHDIKRFRQSDFLESLGVAVVPVRGSRTLAADVRQAFKAARAGRGPVALSIPWDLLDGDFEGSWSYEPATEPVTPYSQRLQPDAEKIREAAAILAASERPPIILAGRGAVTSGAKEAIERLAERLGALLATTLQGKDLFAGHPYNLGVIGTFATTLAADFIARSDCVLAVGCSLNNYTTHSGQLLMRPQVIQIDADPARIEAVTPVDLAIVADAKAAVEALEQELEREGVNRAARFWTDALRQQIAAVTPIHDGVRDWPDTPGTMDPRDFIVELDRILPENRLIVMDGGHFVRWVIDGITVGHPDNMVWTLDFAAIGQGLGAAIGAALARRDRHTVLIAGDAGFMMAIQELETAVRYGVPLTVIVMNDQALGSEFQNLRKAGRPVALSCIETPDLASVARSFGARGLTVRSLDEVPYIAEHIDPSGTPLVVDARINREVRHRSK